MYFILRSLRDCFKSGKIAGKVGICLLLASFGTLIAGNADAQVAGGPIYCGASASLAVTTTETQIIAVPATGSAHTYICGYVATATAASTVTFQYGTGTNCATGSTNFGPVLNLPAGGGVVDSSPAYRGFAPLNAAGTPVAVCATGTAAANVTLYYVQQ